MTDDKAKHQTTPSQPPTQAAKRKGCRWWIITALVLFISILCGLGYVLLDIDSPTAPYAYWKNLIAKDPRPEGVSEKEYVEKNRTGYCWRDRKFYKPEELQQKAMVSFVEKLLAEADAFQSNKTTNQGGKAQTARDCARSQTDCRVWFIPFEYTNSQWDKLLLTKSNPITDQQLIDFGAKEIRSLNDLQAYITEYKGKKFSLNKRDYGSSDNLFGSDCCTVWPSEKILPRIHKDKLITHLEDGGTLPENHIPENVSTRDYRIGNFYFETKQLIAGLYFIDPQEKTYLSKSSDIFLMNNCGDILWQPFYYDM